MAKGYDPIEASKVVLRPKREVPATPPASQPAATTSAEREAGRTPLPPPAPAKVEPPPVPKERWRVTERATVWTTAGTLTVLAKDSVVGPHTHDMQKLRDQHVKMEPLA